MKIAVAGATGRVGRHLVDALESGGHEAVAIARSTGVDVITGTGLDDALVGVDVIIDAATGPSPDEQEATAFFTTAARNLQAAGERAGVRRIVVVSIIGLERMSGGYSVAKLAHERALLSGPIPARVLRASQFHEFVAQLVDWGRNGDVSNVAQMRSQPVAARTVAEALVELATAPEPATPEPAGTPFPEIAGPREESIVELAMLLTSRRGDPVKIQGGLTPGDPDAEPMATGALLPSPHATLAGPTFEEWLDSNS